MLHRGSLRGPCLVTTAAILFVANVGQAATRRVCATGGAPYTRIADALAASRGGDIIDLCAGTYTEANLRVDKAITVRGAGAAATIVQAAPVAGAAASRVFEIDLAAVPRGTVILRDLTIRFGRALTVLPRHGGGILVRGAGSAATVSVEGCVVEGNAAGTGGGIAIEGAHVSLAGSRVAANNAEVVDGIDYPAGGGVACLGCQLELVDTSVQGNSAVVGGGLATFEGELRVTRSSLHGNSASERGGGLYLFGNTSFANSTVSGNMAPADAGLTLVIEPSVGSGRSEIVQCTIAANGGASGVGLAVHAGTVAVANSLISGHGGADCFLIGGLELAPGAMNLDSDGTCAGFSLSNAEPALGALGDNGGLTPTHALLDGSAALSVGISEVCLGALAGGEDQRGSKRPPTGPCDLGAFERRNL